MGDKMFNITRAELDDHAKKMREHTEANILMMDRLFSIGENYQKKSEKLESQLQEETRKRVQIEDSLNKTKVQLQESEKLNDELNGRLESVTEELETERDSFKEQLGARDKRIKDMEQAVKDAEGLLIGLKYLKRNVDSFRLGHDVLTEPCGACMLPDGRVIVADTLKGLFLFSHNTELIKHVESTEWKWPQGLVYDKDLQQIVVSMRQKVDKDKWTRIIGFFDLELEQKHTLLGPSSDIGQDNAAKESLTMTRDGMAFFLCVTDVGTSTIYRLARGDTKWVQVINRPGATLLHLQVLATTGSITQLFALETRMANVQKFAIRETDVADRKTMALVERPGALCIDGDGTLFVHDKMSGKIVLFDTYRYEKQSDLCLVDDDVVSLTAAHGYLGIAVRGAKTVLVQRYKSDASALAASEK